ncbi:MAG: low specificity L-threonine aldolase [Actinobacteria bacterium]|nr:low specificity L-threonine aldolase [Actinomycetota bacterium]
MITGSNVIDLRSDTVTKPSVGMRAAMANAEVGDDVYSDDPTVNSLEERVAELFGKEAALFTPSGSLANQLAIRSLVSPGDELICETNSHIARAELGAGAVFSGITTRTWLAERGLLNATQVLELARPDSGPYLVSTTAIAIENTHNFGGGSVQPMDQIALLSKQAEELGLYLHLDGARIWNAHVASGIPLSEYGKYFETISVCLSKGLGAPVGSLMISSKERIASSRVWRKRYGAGMRQVGILAAAGHFALDNNIARIAEDHLKAKKLAHACAGAAPTTINPDSVETNIIGLDLSEAKMSAIEFASAARQKGLWVSALGENYVRLVTHMDISDEANDRACFILQELLNGAFMVE